MITLRETIAFVGGGVLGSVITYFVSKNYFQDLYDDYISDFTDELEDVRAYYEPNEENENDVPKIEYSISSSINPEEVPIENRKKTVDDYIQNIKTYNYASISKKKTKEDEESSDVEEESSPIEDNPTVYFEMINEDRFETEDGRTKKTFTYWVNDGIAVNDYDQPIENFNMLYFSGDLDNWFYMLEQNSVKDLRIDPDVLYLRDNEHDIDYEIIRVHNSFVDPDAVEDDKTE